MKKLASSDTTKHHGKAPRYKTFAELFFSSYSGLLTLAVASRKGKTRYDRGFYAFRESVIRKLRNGEMKVGDLYMNNIRRFTTPSNVCWYCGRMIPECGQLTADHIFPRMKGGDSSGDNLMMVCKSCNSSKGSRDLLEWYSSRGEFPPLRVLAHYLKLVYSFATTNFLLDKSLGELRNVELPFDYHFLPRTYPQPDECQNDFSPIQGMPISPLADFEQGACNGTPEGIE